jgi:hypothetical protein
VLIAPLSINSSHADCRPELYAGVLGAELTAKGDQRTNLQRSGLYYLLSLQRFHETRTT